MLNAVLKQGQQKVILFLIIYCLFLSSSITDIDFPMIAKKVIVSKKEGKKEGERLFLPMSVRSI